MLRRMSVGGHEERARALDWHVTYWGFPALTIVSLWVMYVIFLA